MLLSSISQICEKGKSTAITNKKRKIIHIFKLVNCLMPRSNPLNTLHPKVQNQITKTKIRKPVPSAIPKTCAINFDITGTAKPKEVVMEAIIPKTTTISMILPNTLCLKCLPNNGVSVFDNFTSSLLRQYNIYPIATAAGI